MTHLLTIKSRLSDEIRNKNTLTKAITDGSAKEWWPDLLQKCDERISAYEKIISGVQTQADVMLLINYEEKARNTPGQDSSGYHLHTNTINAIRTFVHYTLAK